MFRNAINRNRELQMSNKTNIYTENLNFFLL